MLVKPDHVIITTTGKSHTESFEKIEDIAKEKASITKWLQGERLFYVWIVNYKKISRKT